MYKNAGYRRTAGQDTDEEEERRGRLSLKTADDFDAAGVRPAGSSDNFDFVERVKMALERYLDSDPDLYCYQLAEKLSRDGIVNAKGGPWTSRLVKTFADRYLKSKPPF